MGIFKSIFFIFLSITFYRFVAAEIQSIPGHQTNIINSTSTLVSSGGKFTLGFFTISATNFTYLGIWYTNGNPDNKVWVANRDIPMIGSGDLIIDNLGTLKVVNESGITLFNVSTQISSENTVAVLEDSGNLVVNDSTTNQNLWQSFDHPTDTLLPGMKLGYNLTTKQNWTLTSWLSDQNPATGQFTMKLEQYQNSPQLLIYQRGEIYKASGPWVKDNGTFQLLVQLNNIMDLQYNWTLISDASGMWLTSLATTNLELDSAVPPIISNSSTLQITSDGQIMGNNKITITPKFCYQNQSDDWCVVSASLPTCRSKNDNFTLKSGSWTSSSMNYDNNSSISLIDCMERCWNDCNCVGFISNENGCMTYVANKPFVVDESGAAIKYYVLVSPEPPPKKKTWIWISVSVEIVLAFAITSCLCYGRIRKRKHKEEEKRLRDDYIHQLTGGSDSFNYGDELERGIQDAPDIKIFSIGAILTATNNYSNENKLGQGGYGPVYKGKLFDGREIAVKRLSKTSGQGIEEFKSELILISKLQHTNLVRLYGCCIHQEEKMLIYEFMPNKSLDFFLFADDQKEKINWKIRFNIIEGVAQGLLYLHKYSRMKVIHRDLKVSNVLLDGNMNPKIADFGLARIFKQDVTEAVTNRVVGTYGYMAPEYAMEGTFSIKSDVFSFGVLILEIVSGKRNSSFYNLDRPLNLVGYAWELWKGQAALELKDKALGESYDVKQLLRAIHVGLLCVQENADDRPTMSEVISMINNEIADLPIAKQPAFFTGRQATEFGLTETKSTDYSLDEKIPVLKNSLTITTMKAR